MYSVLIPVCLLLGIILINRLPYIGGEIRVGLLVSGVAALTMGGVGPLGWINAAITGIDKISWVISLVIFGSLYGESQVALGTMSTVLNSLRAAFGRSPRGLISSIIVCLVIAGSLLGDAIASATVVGVLVIKSLHELGLTGEQISATIVMGACLGSIMPPITQAFFLSSSLMGLPSPDPVVNIGYFTIGLGVVICCLYAANFFSVKRELPADLIPNETAFQIITAGWKTLVPMGILIAIIVLRTAFKIEVLDVLNPVFTPIKKILILRGIDFAIVKALIVCLVISFAFKPVRQEGINIFKSGLKNIGMSLQILLCAGFMIGAFTVGGQLALVQAFAKGLSEHVLKIGGAAAMLLIGMLTGSQTTAQTSIFTFFGPALQANGLDPVYAGLAGAHLAMSGQGMPPADLTTFVVAGLVGGILGIKVDPVRSMFYSMVMCIYFLIVGMVFLYI
jgi:TRAP-type C4-dicarboxylate transport system permease large subunit